jgi:hypothetical protein
MARNVWLAFGCRLFSVEDCLALWERHLLLCADQHNDGWSRFRKVLHLFLRTVAESTPESWPLIHDLVGARPFLAHLICALIGDRRSF